jgi:radical SAM protein with 4Fe4S-binding SPASM domain
MPIANDFDFFIQLHITERCNLKCKHCYQTGGRQHEMTLAEIRALISEASAMLKDWTKTYDIGFSPGVNITGGEPFLRHDIFEILNEFMEAGFETHLLSNGTLITSDKAKVLGGLGVKGVQISIEGPEEIHEGIRGMGSFFLSLNGIKHLLNAGIEVTMNTTLSEANAAYFMDIVKLAYYMGVQKLGFSRLVPSGRGAAMLDKMLKAEQISQLYEEIFSLNTSGFTIVTGDPVASQMKDVANEAPLNHTFSGIIPSGGCAAGVSGLTILPDGTVMPCRRLPVPIGNVRTDSLREIWATSDVLNLLRVKSKYSGKCAKCGRWSMCRGCRAIAYAYSQAKGENNFLAEDPQCFIISE